MDDHEATQVRGPSIPRPSRLPLPALLWSAATFLCVASAVFLFAQHDRDLRAMFLGLGPLSTPDITGLSILAAWGLFGWLTLLLARRRLTAASALNVFCFLAIGLLYVNVLRERSAYGDVNDYIRAAGNLYFGQPLHHRYLYPPLWAMLLQPLVPLGPRAMLDVCWSMNLFSLLAFYPLLRRALREYGYARNLATLATFAFMLVNVPILRTLFYVQVNLHVMNLVFVALLVRRRSAWLSALCLALAVHLKASPVLLVLAFVAAGDLAWMLWFGAFVAGIYGVTLLVDGPSPWADYLRNLGTIYGANGLEFRENSFDSFFRALAGPTGMGDVLRTCLVAVSKLGLLAVCAWIGAAWYRRRPFGGGPRTGSAVHQLFPVLLVLMMMMSPLVWEHHPVFVALPFLLLAQLLETRAEWIWFGAGYLMEFLLPTFDFFPWSYGRLFGALIWLGLACALARRGRGLSSAFEAANRWSERLSPGM